MDTSDTQPHSVHLESCFYRILAMVRKYLVKYKCMFFANVEHRHHFEDLIFGQRFWSNFVPQHANLTNNMDTYSAFTGIVQMVELL